MKVIKYQDFSWGTHFNNSKLKKINSCQFELTFRCGLHCKHCYSDCYNKLEYSRKELQTNKVKLILDKLYNAGVIWLCFTGGDPLVRRDFIELYTYAKKKGFIVTIFTNGYSIDEKIVNCFKELPPFVIELTLNGATEHTYEKISQVKGSFALVKNNIDLVLKSGIKLKIKTQVTIDNVKELSKIEEFIDSRRLEIKPSFDLFPRLDGDLTPCSYRLSPQDILDIVKEKIILPLSDFESCGENNKSGDNNLFQCAIGNKDNLLVDPYGNTFPCMKVRTPNFDLLVMDIKYALNKLNSYIKNKKFCSLAKCALCKLRKHCYWCPGKSLLENKNMESEIDYYCDLARTFGKMFSAS